MKLAILADSRFPGGTSSAIAAELDAISEAVVLTLYDIGGRMFRNREPNQKVVDAASRNGHVIRPGRGVITADVVVLHNPVLLKFEETLPFRINSKKLIVVTHENFLSPHGDEEFDITKCLGLLERASICEERWLAPISAWNRKGVTEWCAREACAWNVVPFDWFNICSFELDEITPPKGDRRGRLSRPGAGKFPDTHVMADHFGNAEEVHILGADRLIDDPEIPAGWNLYPFGAMPVAELFQKIDFFVYFTNSAWRESFGRVIAEAIAAGKPVITDPGTAAIFGNAVIATDGNDIDAIIAGMLADPEHYTNFARVAQSSLSRFSPESFRTNILGQIHTLRGKKCF